MIISEKRYSSRIAMTIMMSVAIVAGAALTAKQDAWADAGDREGKVVVETVCAACHGTGEQGAPKIGDAEAWTERASQGLTMLSKHAIDGIRRMPAHGGSPGVTDFEIMRAITYMVNQSGGSWVDPIDKSALRHERSGEQIVQAQCAKCHQAGEGGAPRIGDRSAWVPRLRQGLDAAIRSAINGHGGMPPRGGMANLTDSELKSALTYMFNPVSAPVPVSSVAPTAVPGARHQVIRGVAIYFGIIPVDSMRAAGNGMHGGIPSGKGYYHVNITLLNSKTGEQISDARVELTVKDPVMGVDKKELELMAINNTISYGNYFQVLGSGTHSIVVHVHRPGLSRAINANFKFKRY